MKLGICSNVQTSPTVDGASLLRVSDDCEEDNGLAHLSATPVIIDSTIQPAATQLPAFSPVPNPNFKLNGFPGLDFVEMINQCYSEAVHIGFLTYVRFLWGNTVKPSLRNCHEFFDHIQKTQLWNLLL